MRPHVPELSRSRFGIGTRCRKRLYLECFHAEPTSLPAAVRAQRAAAAAVAVAARRRFPDGVDVGTEPRHAEAVARTRHLLVDAGVRVVYDAAFAHAGARVRVGVAVRRGGRLDLVDVKAATRVSERHEVECALLLLLAEGTGLDVGRVSVLHLDRDYVHAGGPPDLGRLFVEVDLSEPARARRAEVAAALAAMRAALEAEAPPEVATGAHCVSPARCPYYARCHPDEVAHPLSELPRGEPAQLAALAAHGVEDLRDVPDDFPGLTPVQQRAVQVVRRGAPHFDPALGAALGAVRTPIHYVDFETFGPAIPVHPGTRPYMPVPYQWSAHVRDAGGGLTHRDFLHDHPGDPRRPFAESLLGALGEAGSIVTYSSFEADVLWMLAGALPDLAPRLAALEARIVDLLLIVRAHCYHPAFRGSFSLKAVLPALVPALGYEDLAIRNGLMAMLAYEELLDPATAPARRAQLGADMRAYCARDTLALVELYRALWDGR